MTSVRSRRSAPDDLAAIARQRVAALSHPPGWVPAPPDAGTDVPGGAVDPPPARPTPGTGHRGRRSGRPAGLGARVRLAISGPAAAGLTTIALAGVLLGTAFLLRSEPVTAELPPRRAPTLTSVTPGAGVTSPPRTGASTAGRPTTGTPGVGPGTTNRLLVHVAGRVRRAGVVSLPSGARVQDAVAAAGGLARGADPAAVNLARPLADGEQIFIPAVGGPRGGAGPAPPGDGGAAAGGAAVLGPVDLNAATLEQLDTLPGVGPVLAQRILDWRAAHGRFSAVEELQEVDGIGERTFAELAPRVRV